MDASESQLELPIDPPPKRPYPAKDTEMVIYHKHPTRQFPGSPVNDQVHVYVGWLDCVIPAGRPPFESLIERNIMTMNSRASKYDRVVLRLKSKWATRAARFKVFTMNREHTWRLASEAGTL